MKRYERCIDRTLDAWEEVQNAQYIKRLRLDNMIAMCTPLTIHLVRCDLMVPTQRPNTANVPPLPLDCVHAIMDVAPVVLDDLLNYGEVSQDWQTASRRAFYRQHQSLHLVLFDLSDVRKACRLIRNFGCRATSVYVSLLHFDDWRYEVDDRQPIIKVSKILDHFLKKFCHAECEIEKFNFHSS